MKKIWRYIKWYVEETIFDMRILYSAYPNILVLTILLLLIAFIL
mgnify:CR=1 FL=1